MEKKMKDFDYSRMNDHLYCVEFGMLKQKEIESLVHKRAREDYEKKLQSLQEENERLLKAVESWKEEEKMWKEFNAKLEEERNRLRDLLIKWKRDLPKGTPSAMIWQSFIDDLEQALKNK